MTWSAYRLLALAVLVGGGCSATHVPSDRDASMGSDAEVSDAEVSHCGPPSMLAPDASASTEACCNDGLFEVHAVDRVYALRIDGCGADWRCEVDGVERSCGIGHGTLLLRLTDELGGPGLQLAIYDCIGDAAIGYYDDANAFNVEVPVCRVN